MSASSGAGAAPVSLVRDAKDALVHPGIAFESAHDACIEAFTALLPRLCAAKEAAQSTKKRVAVKGTLFMPDVPGIKFSIDYSKGAVGKIRVQTLADDFDKSAVPAEFGGTGLMAATSDDEATRAEFPPKAKRARTTPTLQSAVERALELAKAADNEAVASALESLLKTL